MSYTEDSNSSYVEDESSVESADIKQLTNPFADHSDLTRKQRHYEIDHVGNGSFQVSQLNLLTRRSLEPVRTVDAMLSARGLHHRSRDFFVKEVSTNSNIIKGMMRGEKVTSGHYKPSAQLFQPHFARALAFERVEKIDAAIADYNVCLSINPQSAVCHFNRAGLHRIKKQFTQAIDDMHAAVRLEPANPEYRAYRAVICREAGDYAQAMQDTLVSRALTHRPEVRRLVEKSGEAAVTQMLAKDVMALAYGTSSTSNSHSSGYNPDGSAATGDGGNGFCMSDDPVLAALKTPGPDRTEQDLLFIRDFLRTVKIFMNVSNTLALTQIAAAVSLNTYEKNAEIFKEGDPGNHFYIIFDGEVSITRTKVIVEAGPSPANNNSNNNAAAPASASAASSTHASAPPLAAVNNSPSKQQLSTSSLSAAPSSTTTQAPPTQPQYHQTVDEAITETIVLVKLFRGQSFGETALESRGGLRTAGAMASQPSRLLCLHVDAYHSILHRFRAALKEEVRAVVATSPLFQEWESAKIDHLASLVIIKSFAANTEIMSAGKVVPCLMLVKSGIVTLLKGVPRSLLRAQPQSLAAQTSQEDLSRSGSKKLLPPIGSRKSASSNASSAVFGGETPGLWIVNKSWTTRLDEQTLRRSTPHGSNGGSGPASGSNSAHASNRPSMLQNSNSNRGSNANSRTASRASSAHRSRPTSSKKGGANSGGERGGELRGGDEEAEHAGSSQGHHLEDKVEFAVGILGSGQVFGELAVLNATQLSPLSAVSSTAVELYCFESDVLAALGARFHVSTVKALLESLTLHDPPIDKIGFFYRQKHAWETRKHQLMNRLRGKEVQIKNHGNNHNVQGP